MVIKMEDLAYLPDVDLDDLIKQSTELLERLVEINGKILELKSIDDTKEKK